MHGSRTRVDTGEGLTRLVGHPQPKPHESLLEAMEREHCGEADADVAFDARNYRTRTTSRLEWSYVASPADLPKLVRRDEPRSLSTSSRCYCSTPTPHLH